MYLRLGAAILKVCMIGCRGNEKTVRGSGRTAIALRFDARAFVPYGTGDYDEKFRKAYPFSLDNGMFVVRANLQGMRQNDYVVAGRNRGRRSVMAVMRRTDGNGWTVQSTRPTSSTIASSKPDITACPMEHYAMNLRGMMVLLLRQLTGVPDPT